MSVDELFSADKYDLHDADACVKLGGELGNEWSRELMPLIKALSMEQRIVFICALLGGPVGQSCAAIGSQATLAILDTLKMLAVGFGERNETAN